MCIKKSPQCGDFYFHINRQQKIPIFQSGFLYIPGISAGAGNVTRTRDLRITNALLYQLSYSSIFFRKKCLQIMSECGKI